VWGVGHDQEVGVKYLITGCSGFIGSHLAEALVGRGDEVVGLDDLSTGNRSNVANLAASSAFQLVEGSILDEELVRKLVGGVDVVFHLAASVGVHLIIRRPLESLITNIRGSEIVLEACADEGKRVLLTSTSEIYGKNRFGALSEDSDRILGSTFKTRWSYSTAKAVDEILAHAYWREMDTPTIVARLFNTVGPRQTGMYGMVVPTLVRQALLGTPLTVFGSGEQQRCFCHVSDTVAALLTLIDDDRALGDVFNVGAPQEISINELAETIVGLTASDAPIEHVPYEVAYEPGFEDMERRVPDITKITTLTGWRPARDLESILTDVIDYHRASIPAA
jgi:UDP-glucose 4-epimerase